MNIDASVRRAIGGVWANLPDDGRNRETLERETARLVAEALATFDPAADHGPYAAIRAKFPNAGRAWRSEDDEQLRRLYRSGNAVGELSTALGRTPHGIELRLERLGEIQPKAAA